MNLRNLLEKFFCSNCVIACFGGLNILKAKNENSGATSNIRQVSLLLTSKTFSTLNLKEKSEIRQTSKIVVFEKILNNVSTGQKWVKSKVIDLLKLKPWSHADIATIKDTYLKPYQISMMELFKKKMRQTLPEPWFYEPCFRKVFCICFLIKAKSFPFCVIKFPTVWWSVYY